MAIADLPPGALNSNPQAFMNPPPQPALGGHEKHEGFSGQRLVVVPRPVLATAMNQPLIRNLLPSEAGYYPKARGHQCTREKGCAETVFIYCARGAGWCEMAGNRHAVQPDQLLVIPAGTPHVYGAEKKEPWTIHWFHAVGINVPFYLAQLQVTREKPVVSLAGGVRLFSLFEDVLEDLEHGATLMHLTYAAHSLGHLMGILLRQRNDFWDGEHDVRKRALESAEFMKQHLREPLRVSTLAAIANLSRSHYTTVFKRATGYAPLLYLNHLRLQRAVQLLNSTNLSIKAISDELGFSDQFYFSRAFSKLHGHSPSEHRRRYLD
jgi:AraC family transcriptional regulator of arabinose operon